MSESFARDNQGNFFALKEKNLPTAHHSTFILYAYAESPTRHLSTTKGTKDTKRDCQFIFLFCIRNLRALRGGITVAGTLLKHSIYPRYSILSARPYSRAFSALNHVVLCSNCSHSSLVTLEFITNLLI
jgi:hypothetical protein